MATTTTNNNNTLVFVLLALLIGGLAVFAYQQYYGTEEKAGINISTPEGTTHIGVTGDKD